MSTREVSRAVMIIKHEAVQRSLIGEIIQRIERKGLKIIAMKMAQMTEDLVKALYEKSMNEPYFPEMLRYNSGCPVVMILVEGIDGNKNANEVCGRVGEPGTVRGDFVLHSARNVLHCSDPDVTDKEINLFFTEDEIHLYELANEKWVI